jgi:hypothetical protein
MALILNEVKRAEEIINDGEIGNKPSATLFLLAKYYRKYYGYNLKETISKLNDFMKKYYPNYNYVLWENIIEDISRNSIKFELRQIEDIGITQKEFNIIKSLNNLDHEKLVFTMLCYAKVYNASNVNNNNWVNCSIPELFKIARVSVKYKNDKMYMLNDIKNNLLIDSKNDKGNDIKQSLISFSRKNDNKNIKLNFIDDSNDYILCINDFRELGYEYLTYLGEKYSRCETCGVLFKQNKNSTYKYCIKHRGYQPIGTKTIKCIDCGNDVKVDGKVKNKKRCDECQKKYDLERNRIRVQKFRNNQDNM